MSLFRVDPDKPFDGPHQDGDVLERGPSASEASAAVILIHGRGASAQSMLPLVDEFGVPGVHYVAPQASGHTWYPYSFLQPIENNQPGISSGLQRIHDLITRLEQDGTTMEKIMLLGFSQGGCLATEFAARHPARYGGVVGYSGGLIGPDINPGKYEGDMEETPVFLGCSTTDPHIPKERVDETEVVFKKLGANVTKKLYPGMPHTVNEDEIQIVRSMIKRILG
jgi:predicted esterase